MLSRQSLVNIFKAAAVLLGAAGATLVYDAAADNNQAYAGDMSVQLQQNQQGVIHHLFGGSDEMTQEALNDRLKRYVAQKGAFNPDAHDSAGFNEAMVIAQFLGTEGLETFAENGGRFNPQAVTAENAGKMTEAMVILKSTGFQGLKIFLENGGSINMQHQDINGHSEQWYIKRYAGEKGPQLTADYAGTASGANTLKSLGM